MTRRSAIALCLSAAGCRRASSGFAGYAYVADEAGQNVAVVDLARFAVAKHVALGASPSQILRHPAHKGVFVLAPDSGLIFEIAGKSPAVSRKVRLADRASSMQFAPDGSALWVLCREPKELVRIPLDTFQPAARIPLPFEPFHFDLAQDGRLCAVSYGTHGGLTIFPLPGGKAGQSIPIGATVGDVRFRADSRYLIAANVDEKRISILDTPSGRLVTHLPLAVRPERFCFKADGGQLFVTGEGMDAVVVVYPYSTEVDGTLLAGRSPGVMAVSAPPETEYLFVANPPTGDVTILEIETRSVVAVVAIGDEPGNITLTPDSQYALVLTRRSGSMAVIRVADLTRIPPRTRSAPLLAMIPVGSKPVSAVVQQL